jgi:hypothetical protein
MPFVSVMPHLQPIHWYKILQMQRNFVFFRMWRARIDGMQHAHTSLLSDSIVCYRMLLSEPPNILEIVWGPIGALLMTTLHALVFQSTLRCAIIYD